jgi:type I restriction enzyme M protein
MEFVKLMFLKLLSDKAVHSKYPTQSNNQRYTIPSADVQFSSTWIASLQDQADNPMATIAFAKLRRSLEDEIAQGKKKRIFRADEELSLSPETIRGVVEKIESIDLYSIDADLNGRLFETFLNATMRGKDLGQYFTPRSIVKLMVRLACLSAGTNPVNIPTILDPCCGSGGFLIDALWDMWEQVEQNKSLTSSKRQELKQLIATTKIVGIDAGKEPPIARIARINMYLHGDGGSRIYFADGLDKSVHIDSDIDAERKSELRELKALVSDDGLADIILTNPPFSKVYESKHEPEKRILLEYELGSEWRHGRRTARSSVKTNALFLERYWDLLRKDGRVIAIVDDSILGGKKDQARELVRRKFIIEAVISLPGDAFQRSKARVKTSVIVLRKRTNPDEDQPPIFMYYCNYVGIDDPNRVRSLPIDSENRQRAADEIKTVGELFQAFQSGNSKAESWIVPGNSIEERMDVKSCLPKPGRLIESWKKQSLQVVKLHELVDVFDEDNLLDDDVIDTSDSEETVTFLRVRYDGIAESGEEKEASDSGYATLLKVHEGDLIISNINAVHGAIAIVPPDLAGHVVSSEYTICRAKDGVDPKLVWLLVRSPEARSDLVLLASGIGRTRVTWDNVRELEIAIPSPSIIAKASELIERSVELSRSAEKARKDAEQGIYSELGLDNYEAWSLINAFKPPR